MARIKNLTRLPLKLHLPGGKKLHLGPNQIGQVNDQALERPSIRELLEKKSIEVLDDGQADRSAGSRSGGGSSGAGSSGRGAQGHQPPGGTTSRGDR